MARSVLAIVFDLDGTLIDSYGPIADSLNHARAHFDLPPLSPSAVRRRVGRGLETLIAELVGPQRVPVGVRLFRERYAEVYATGTFVLPDVAETLGGLARSGYRMGVASNKPAHFSEPLLERLGLRSFFRCVLGPDSVNSHKPEPLMIRRCLECLAARPAQAVYVGDMDLDVESAARAGVPLLLVPGGSTDARSLAASGQPVLRSFAELRQRLGGPPS